MFHAPFGIDVDGQGQDVLPAVPRVAEKIPQGALNRRVLLSVPVDPDDDAPVVVVAEGVPHVAYDPRALGIHQGDGFPRLEGQAGPDLPPDSEFPGRPLLFRVRQGASPRLPSGFSALMDRDTTPFLPMWMLSSPIELMPFAPFVSCEFRPTIEQLGVFGNTDGPGRQVLEHRLQRR